MWIKTQEGSIINANSIAEFAEFNGYVNAYFNDDTRIVIADYKNNSVIAAGGRMIISQKVYLCTIFRYFDMSIKDNILGTIGNTPMVRISWHPIRGRDDLGSKERDTDGQARRPQLQRDGKGTPIAPTVS